MIIYGSPASTFVMKVLLFAAEKGIAVDLVTAGMGRSAPGFEEASPFGKIPALRDGDFTIADSSAIVVYLDAMGAGRLIPDPPRERAQAVWFEELADGVLATCVAAMFMNRVVAPLLGVTPDLAAADKAERDDLPPLLDYLERSLAERDHLVGSAFSIADIAVVSQLVSLGHAGGLPSIEQHSALAGYFDRALARPSFQPALAMQRQRLSRGPASSAPPRETGGMAT